MATSPERSRDLLLSLAAFALACCAAAQSVVAPGALSAGTPGPTWIRWSAIAAATAAALVGSGLLFGRIGRPGRPLLAGGAAVGILTILTIVLGGVYVVVDEVVDADDALLLGALVAVPAVGALWLADGWLLRPRRPRRSPLSGGRRTRA